MQKDDLVYSPRPKAPEDAARRVYVLPRELVKRIHEYGYQNDHPSEVSAVRALLEKALGPIPSKKRSSAGGWVCPIGHKGCTQNCGNYGCGN